MKALATAIINLAAFIELSDDDTIDPDNAVRALDQLAHDLSQASAGEVEYIKAAIREQIGRLPCETRSADDQKRVDFLLNFIEDLDVGGEQ